MNESEVECLLRLISRSYSAESESFIFYSYVDQILIGLELLSNRFHRIIKSQFQFKLSLLKNAIM